MLRNLHYVKELGYRSRAALESGNLVQLGELMHEHWEHKKRRSGRMSNEQIDEWYELATQQRRGRRQAGRRRRRWIPDVLRRGSQSACGVRWRTPACKRCASSSTSKAPNRSCRDYASRCDTRGWAGHAAASGSPKTCRSRCCRSPVARSSTGSSACWRSRVSPTSCCASVISASRSGAPWATARLWRGGSLLLRRSAPARNRRRIETRAAACWARHFFVLYGDSYVPLLLRRGPGGV